MSERSELSGRPHLRARLVAHIACGYRFARPHNHPVVPADSLMPELSYRASDNRDRSEHPDSPACCNVRSVAARRSLGIRPIVR